ncbi:MAG: hypothetical protein IK093_04555, partial [Ruminiclostridium sp.]|nr:hypothetical protein [Ruminiclostridium sp.]
MIFRVGDNYISFAEKDKGDYYAWKFVEGIAPGGLDIPDGGFARVKADVTWLSGGIAGFMENPQIDRIISTEPAGLDEMIDYCGIENYDPQSESPLYNRPLVYNDYLIIDLYGECHVYRGGETVVKDGTNEDVEKAIG